MGSQQFCLKWNNHQSNMLAVFEQLLSNEALVDVTLACEGLSLKAHKMVLSACSPFFQALFVENPCKHPIVIMKDMRYMDLKAIVEFMYRGEVNVSQDQLSALLKTAETLKVKGLAEVTGENKHGALVSVDGADPKPVGTPRAESPPLSKRKRGRPRRRSPSDSNKSDSEDQGGPPATRIKGPESPEIIEDGSLSSDRVTALPAASPSSRTSSTVAVSSTAVPPSAHLGSTAKATNSLATSQHTQDSIGDDVGEGDDADFEVEPSNLMEQSMTTENVPVFTDVASSSQALGNESQQSHHTGSTSDSTALVPVQASLPSDISISSQVDIKPSPSSLIPYDDQAISPVVAAPPAAAASSAEGASMAMMFMDSSGVPAIAGPSNYHPDKQQSTPSHATHGWQALGVAARQYRGPSSASASLVCRPHWCSVCNKCYSSAAKLRRHQTMHYLQRKFYKCSYCPRRYSWMETLHVHMKRIHAVSQFYWRPRKKTGTFRCDVCGKPFSNKANMQRHKVLHATVRDVYFCDVCSRPFSWKSSLERHKRDMHAALASGSGAQRNESSRVHGTFPNVTPALNHWPHPWSKMLLLLLQAQSKPGRHVTSVVAVSSTNRLWSVTWTGIDRSSRRPSIHM
ncbi:longitudinals lacking protein, isoforms H/M/V-like isoform X5 [Dermacentor albipictus]|uniref:longitudinals lacking protein, isoforms H/M/V-like isoform X5 n=1 Tax=Dermacentor albipictus TaxID=60249 RepID=UPI0031FD6094